ncbi:porin family protein [Spirosoma oryzae]|nr:porin family protein [Spirosoma oryzae]
MPVRSGNDRLLEYTQYPFAYPLNLHNRFMNQFWRLTLSSLTLTLSSLALAQGQTAPPNRQQDLYDRYYGVDPRRPAAKPPTKAARVPRQRPRVVQPLVEADRPMVAVSQPTAYRTTNVQIGARGGVLTPVLLDKNASFSAGTDFVGGVMLVLGSGWIQFQPEVNYSRTAFRSRFLGTGVRRAATDQVVVPMLARFSLGHAAGNQVYALVGPYSAYGTSTSLNGQKVRFDPDEQRLSYGAAAGVGVAIRTGPGHINLELRGRYQLSATNQAAFESRPSSIYTEATLSYLYPLGRR